MENNQNNINTSNSFTNVSNNIWNNLEKMETNEQHNNNNIILEDHHQIPISSSMIWQNYNMMAPQPPSSSGLLSDILGIHQENHDEEQEEELGAMKEMMYKIAAMQPVDIDPTTIRKPKRRNVRISDDPQSVAARHRRERISEKIRILQRLVPGGTKMDTASMLDEAIRYVKFLKRQIRLLQSTPQTQQQQLLPLSQCISTTSTSAFFLSPSLPSEWPFAPNLLLTSTTTTAELPAGVPFQAGGNSHVHACDGSSTFNHHEVKSETHSLISTSGEIIFKIRTSDFSKSQGYNLLLHQGSP